MKDLVSKKDFVHFLNRAYCISSHLAERLDELKDSPLFVEARTLIAETVSLLELRQMQIDGIFAHMNVDSDISDCEPVISLLENLFTVTLLTSNKTPHLSLLDYLAVADVLLAQSSEMVELTLIQLPSLNFSEYFLNYTGILEPLKKLLEGGSLSNR